MATVTVPLASASSQTVTTTLSGHTVRLWIRQLSTGLYMDVWLDDAPLVTGAICLHGVGIIRNPASALPGELIFIDTQASEDPDFTGLGSRWVLAYREND